MNNWSNLGPWLQKMVSVQRAGDRGITAENMEKSQHTDFNEDTTNESASVTCSNVRLWKLDCQKEWRNTFWRLWDELTKKDSAGFVDSKENKWVGSWQSWSKEGTVVDTVKARKLAYYGHTMRQQGSCLKKEIMDRGRLKNNTEQAYDVAEARRCSSLLR